MPLVFGGDYLPLHVFDRSFGAPEARIVANLECAIADTGNVTSKAYSLVLRKDALARVARSGFAALSIANNHVCDAGTAAFHDMVRALNDCCDTQFYGTRQTPFASLVEGETRCAVIGCLEPSRSRRGDIFPLEQVESLVREIAGEFDRVFVTPHWGAEGECASHPSPGQRALARRWIEAGAHAILGHHAHCFHGRERIDGRWVYYSLGNLLFDSDEGRRFPLTRFGLVVGWTAGGRVQEDHWSERVLRQTVAGLQELDDNNRSLLRAYLDAISQDLVEKPWGPVRWARAVGPIYIPKANAAWVRRVAGVRPWRSRLLRLIWSMLPKTFLLRLGYWFPDRVVEQRRRRLEASLGEIG